MFTAIDLFAGCGGLTLGLKQAGFSVITAIEIEKNACETFKLNHNDVKLIERDIRNVSISEIKKGLKGETLYLLAGCPPCQGFSSVRRLNRPKEVFDSRNDLIWEFYRFVKGIKPLTIMMENVPGLLRYHPFQEMMRALEGLGYKLDYDVVLIQKFGIPQRRRRLVLIGSRIDVVKLPTAYNIVKTVRETISDLESVNSTNDILHKRYPHHTEQVLHRIRMTPKDGGSRSDIPSLTLKCHQKPNIGFQDIYGRLRWDAPSSTITGGCLNPSKGRFIHPDEDRCITAREAALLQTFPINYQFPPKLSLSTLALQIGNALPPEFSRIQASNILTHLQEHGFG